MDIENKYYSAKQIKAGNPEGAIGEFLGVPALEQEKGDWYGAYPHSPSGVCSCRTDQTIDHSGVSKVSNKPLNSNSSSNATLERLSTIKNS